MGVQMVADPDQALGLAGARMIREGLDLVRPVHGRAPRIWCAQSTAVRRGSSGSTNSQTVQVPCRT